MEKGKKKRRNKAVEKKQATTAMGVPCAACTSKE
jgi:hypothetical protein